jgi:hypothetical protein
MPSHDVLCPLPPGCARRRHPDQRFEVARTEVIGDFPSEAAREFAQGELDRIRHGRGQGARPITEAEWAALHEVCGGNPLMLTRAVTQWDSDMRQEGGDVRPVETLTTSAYRT